MTKAERKAGRRASMLRNRVSGGPPRITQAERARREALVEGLYYQYGQKNAVVRIMAAGVPVPKLGGVEGEKEVLRLSHSTTERYLSVIERRWVEEAGLTGVSQRRRELFRHAVIDGIRQCRSDKKHSAMMRGYEILGKVDGLFAPQELEVNVSGSVSVGQGLLDGLTPDEIRRYATTGELPNRAPPPTSPGANGSGAAPSLDGGGNGASH